MWTREAVEKLIILYEQHPCLYMVSDPNYKNKMKRRNALLEICEHLKEGINLNTDPDTLLKKINGLRTTFNLEFNKVENSKRSGMGTDDTYKPSWWCFYLLEFLKNSNSISKGCSNISNIENNIFEQENSKGEIIFEGSAEELNELTCLSPSTSHTFQSVQRASSPSLSFSEDETKKQPPTKKRKIDSQNEFFNESTTILKQLVANSINNDHISNFTRSMETEMRRVKNEKLLLDLKKQISNVIFEAQEQQYN